MNHIPLFICSLESIRLEELQRSSRQFLTLSDQNDCCGPASVSNLRCLQRRLLFQPLECWTAPVPAQSSLYLSRILLSCGRSLWKNETSVGKNCLGGAKGSSGWSLGVLREDKGAMAQVPVGIHRNMRSLVLPEIFIDIFKQKERPVKPMIGFKS